MRLVLDTGSSDLWCNAADSNLCSSLSNPCSTSGSYDGDSSSTYSHVSSDFNISYADGSGAAGDYVTDTLRIGDVTVNDFQFGIGYSSTSPGKSIHAFGLVAVRLSVCFSRGRFGVRVCVERGTS